MSFHTDPQPDACRAWMPFPEPRPPGPPSVPLVCHMPKGHDGEHSNERRPSTLSRRWDGDARPPQPEASARPSKPTEGQRQAARELRQRVHRTRGWPNQDAVLAESLAEAEARGHARGVAEAAALRERVEGLAAELDEHVAHAQQEAREWEPDPHRVADWEGKASAYHWSATLARRALDGDA